MESTKKRASKEKPCGLTKFTPIQLLSSLFPEEEIRILELILEGSNGDLLCAIENLVGIFERHNDHTFSSVSANLEQFSNTTKKIQNLFKNLLPSNSFYLQTSACRTCCKIHDLFFLLLLGLLPPYWILTNLIWVGIYLRRVNRLEMQRLDVLNIAIIAILWSISCSNRFCPANISEYDTDFRFCIRFHATISIVLYCLLNMR